jgi:hypothetical protein
MALSNSVEESLETAQAALKNALAFSARQEDAYVSVEIAKMIYTIDTIRKTDKSKDILQKFLKDNNIDTSGFF